MLFKVAHLLRRVLHMLISVTSYPRFGADLGIPRTRAIVHRHLELETLNITGVALQLFERTRVKKQYLHLSAYSCDECAGPVIAGSLGVRENEISKETEIRQVGAICLTCGHRQSKATEPARARYLSPFEWGAIEAR